MNCNQLYRGLVIGQHTVLTYMLLMVTSGMRHFFDGMNIFTPLIPTLPLVIIHLFCKIKKHYFIHILLIILYWIFLFIIDWGISSSWVFDL